MLLGKFDQFCAGHQIPFPPRGNDLDVRLEGVIAQLKAHLIVTLSRRTMGDGIGPGFLCDLDLALGNQWTRNRGTEQVGAFIKRIGAEHREDIIAHEFLAQVFHIHFPNAEHLCLLTSRPDILSLPQIGGEGHDLTLIRVLQPAQNDRGIEAAGIGQHNFFDALGHEFALMMEGLARPVKNTLTCSPHS